MFTFQTKMHVADFSAKAITDFLLNPSDEAYNHWWKGVHLEYHRVKTGTNHTGDVIYMDEFIGKYRMRTQAVVMSAIPGKYIAWQVKVLFRVPIRLFLELEDDGKGVNLTHTIHVGSRGLGRIFDPLWRIFFPKDFSAAMDEHARIEFPMLREMYKNQPWCRAEVS